MGRVIPNENTWIGWLPEVTPGTLPVGDVQLGPTTAEVGNAIDMTCLTMSINASAQGNTVPTPSLCSLFETTVPGTSQATFQADFYRDDAVGLDVAWEELPRGAKGVFLISRFGGTGTDKEPELGQPCEVWPVYITSRTAGALSSNTSQTFQVTAAVNVIPGESSTVQA